MKPITCTANNGVPITYRIFADDVASDTIVLSGGLGGTHLVWSALAKRLRENFRLIVWDYPGLASGTTIPPSAPVDVPSLADYLHAVMNDARLDSAILGGWSLGPQVSLELFRSHPEMVRALIFICGAAANPFSDNNEEEPIAAALGIRSGFPDAVSWVAGRLDTIDRLRSMLSRLEHPTRWAKRLGFVDPLVDELIFDAVIRDFIGMDPVVYRRYVEAAAAHDASDLLGAIHLPVLLVSGQKDRLMTPRRMNELQMKIEGAEHLEARGATHFLPIEYPDLLALKIVDFVSRRVSP